MKTIDTVKHPSELLLSEMTARGMKQKELAIRTGVSEKHISTIVNGNKPISVSFGRKLDIALGDEIGTWAKHQADYDNYAALVEEENGITLEETEIFRRMREITDYFIKSRAMHNNCGDAEKILQLRQLLRVNNLTVIPQITYNAAYRAQINKGTNVDPYILFAWQRLCELKTENVKLDTPFSNKKLAESIPDIKHQMFEDDPEVMLFNLKAIFAKCGVVFDVVHHFRGAPVQGFIKQTEEAKVILCVTIRGKSADKFWFSLFHEVGHLLNGDLSTRFVDFDTVKTEMEEKADGYARDTLIDPRLYKQLVASDMCQNLEAIKACASQAGVPHWVVIGRLHKDEWLDWSYFAHETPSFEWVKA